MNEINEPKTNRAEELAEEHWGYMYSVLRAHDMLIPEIELLSSQYKSAFVHGYKHGQEDM